MDEMTLPPWQHIEVKIKTDTVLARPVEWDSEMIDGEGHNKLGEFVKPITYETVCPFCGNMIHFGAGFISVKCPECKAGEDKRAEAYIPPFQDPGEFEGIMELAKPDENSQLNKILAEVENEEAKT